MNSEGSIKAFERLSRALQRSARLTSIPIEVLISSSTTHKRLRERLESLSSDGLIEPNQAVIAVDPVNRHVALGLGPELAEEFDQNERIVWLRGLQEDLNMTAFENALGLGVLSLAFALSKKFPVRN